LKIATFVALLSSAYWCVVRYYIKCNVALSEKDFRMKKTLAYVLMLCALTFGSMPVFADHHKMKETEKKEITADTNNDGKVSYEEFKAAREKHMEEHFKRRDANGDGYIDQAERKAARENRKAHHKTCKKGCKKECKRKKVETKE